MQRAVAPILLALVALGLLLLLARHLLRDPDAEAPAEGIARAHDAEDAATLAPRPRRGSGTFPPNETGEEVGGEIDGGALPDGTGFQQRLALGARLLRLRTRLAAGAVDAEAVLRQVRRPTLSGTLALDAWEHGLSGAVRAESAEDVTAALLGWLLDPRRDPEALDLHATGTAVEPSLGRGALLRVWTQGEAFPVADLEAGGALLERLNAIGGDRTGHGYDVVATTNMGQELFPHAPLFHWGPPAAGLYATDDDVCLVRTIYAGGFQRVLLKHELVHAFAIRQRGPWASRFLEEGLAEYLSRLRPSDPGLTVPPRRFANEFAALLTLVRRQLAYGIGTRALSFERLLSLEPREFYGLGGMGYLLAQAAVAYAGGDAVEAAVRERTDEPLRSVIRRLTWQDLAAFLDENGVGGRAGEAVVIEDLGPGETAAGEAVTRIHGRRQPRRALRAIGVDVPAGIGDMALGDFLQLPVAVLAQDRDRIESVLRGVRSDWTGALLLVSESTAAMLDPFRWNPDTLESLSELVADPGAIASRAAFVERLVAGLARSGRPRAPTLLIWHGRLQSGSFPLPVMAGPLNTSDLLMRLARQDEAAPSLIVCIASRDGTRETMRSVLAESRGIPPAQVTDAQVTESLRNALSAYLRWLPTPPTRVLVIDLADGAGDARLVAEVFADALGRDAPVALWNPQQPVR